MEIDDPLLQTWNKIFVRSCLLAVFLDPLFFYIPIVDSPNWCLSLDYNLQIIASILRTLIDLFYVYHIVLKFRTGFVAPSSRVFGRSDLVEEPKAIATRYLKTTFIVDVLAILPLPQAVIYTAEASVSNKIVLLEIFIFTQYIPRMFRVYLLKKESTRAKFSESLWGGAAFNLLLYMLASHIIGAFWYLFSIQRTHRCWLLACDRNPTCNLNNLCGEGRADTSFQSSVCAPLEQNEITNPSDFNFGIFLDARRAHVAEHEFFIRKLLYCFWWGLKNLSALGQNLSTSDFEGEMVFAISLCIVGLVLFALLIGNMQKYLESLSVRTEEMRVNIRREREVEQWMSRRMLPAIIRSRVRRHELLQKKSGVEEETLMRNFPKDLKRDIRRHLGLSLLMKVPMFEKMDKQLFDKMCLFLKPVLYIRDSYFVREGDPVDEMLFIMRGDIVTMTTNGGRTGFFNSVSLKAGDFCGDELFTWALNPNSLSLPISTRTLRATTNVEAFSLTAEDLKFVATEFRLLNSNNRITQDIFRFYSVQWRTWGAFFIQAAWRRHCKRKFDMLLREAEDKLQEALTIHSEEAEHKPSLSSTIYASRFACNMLGALRRNNQQSTSLSPQTPPVTLLKPYEPDFSAQKRR